MKGHARSNERNQLGHEHDLESCAVGKRTLTEGQHSIDAISSFWNSLTDAQSHLTAVHRALSARDPAALRVAMASYLCAIGYAEAAALAAPPEKSEEIVSALHAHASDVSSLLADASAFSSSHRGAPVMKTEGFEGYRRGAGYSTQVARVTGAEGKSVVVDPVAYERFAAMRDAARADGIELALVSGARTHAEQTQLYDGRERKMTTTIKSAGLEHMAHPVPPFKENKHVSKEVNEARRLLHGMKTILASREFVYAVADALGGKPEPGTEHFNLAARPGYSNHQDPSGSQAIDIHQATGARYVWLKKHANRFGFIRTVGSEPWHWEYRPGWIGFEHGVSPRAR